MVELCSPAAKATREKRWVHPGLSWVEVQAAAVKIDGGFEIFHVSKATHTTFDRRDLAVHALRNRIEVPPRLVDSESPYVMIA
jgi:hypothetical protein